MKEKFDYAFERLVHDKFGKTVSRDIMSVVVDITIRTKALFDFAEELKVNPEFLYQYLTTKKLNYPCIPSPYSPNNIITVGGLVNITFEVMPMMKYMEEYVKSISCVLYEAGFKQHARNWREGLSRKAPQSQNS